MKNETDKMLNKTLEKYKTPTLKGAILPQWLASRSEPKMKKYRYLVECMTKYLSENTLFKECNFWFNKLQGQSRQTVFFLN